MICAVLASVASATVTVDWVTVGDPGNAGDPAFQGDTVGSGSVNYVYQISKYEVTNSQYAQFLNAKAAADPLGLYNPNMASDAIGGIIRSGASGSYTYAVKSGYESMPVVYVSWYDSVRFANWMNNGQANGGTEFGAYGIAGGTATPSNGNSITRAPGATIFLPTQNEWHKAAYYYPSDGGSYWNFATGSDDAPMSDQPPGPFAPGNSANYLYDDGLANGYRDGYAVTGSAAFDPNQNYLTAVGAYSGSPSAYGTFDQSGNVEEWNESLVSSIYRSYRGGSWDLGPGSLAAGVRPFQPATIESNRQGFRLASIPEPSGFGVIAIGATGLLRRKRRA